RIGPLLAGTLAIPPCAVNFAPPPRTLGPVSANAGPPRPPRGFARRPPHFDRYHNMSLGACAVRRLPPASNAQIFITPPRAPDLPARTMFARPHPWGHAATSHGSPVRPGPR